MRGVKYIGPYFDHSGYGEASRNYILALHKAGVPVTAEARRFEPNPPLVGSAADRAVLQELTDRDLDYDIVIVHLTPDLAPSYIERHPGKRMVSYTVWETSRLHPLWVESCNKMDEVWVPSAWNMESFKASGVNVPLHRIHHGIDVEAFSGIDRDKFSIAGLSPETFVFTSVMQWNARKNPDGLLRAYFNAFTEEDDVRLVLKAYVGRGLTASEDMRQLKEMIRRIKMDMQLPYFPKLNLITESLSTEQLRALYMLGDAYVSLTHGEGFGLTSLEAGLAGKPVIMTGMGGNMEYMTEENSYPVPYNWDFVAGMGTFNPWYWGNQQWARPHIPEASKIMRHVYNNREEASAKGKLLQKNIRENFSWKVVAGQMLARLQEM